MNRPPVVKYTRPRRLAEYPTGPACPSGHLVEINAGWRTFRPSFDREKCTGCLVCYLVCPDGVIRREEGKVAVDYDFCKGCGICAHECRAGAVTMVREET